MSKSIRIGYITQTFPSLTTTFIYREVAVLRELGFRVVTFAIWKPDINNLSEESKGFVDNTHYVFPISWLKLIAAHLRFLFTRPFRYLATLLFVLTRRRENLRNRYRTFFHFCEAIYLAADVKSNHIRHIHAHFTNNAASIALILSRMLNISFSFTAHNIFFTDRLILSEKLREARFIVSISEYSRNFLLQLHPENTGLMDKFHIVRCGVSPEMFFPPADRAENKPPLIFSISQMVERKGYPVLIEACKLLNDRGCRFRCVIAGGGPQWLMLKRLIAEYQLEEIVFLAGVIFQEGLADYLNRADIFVLPCIVASNGDRDGVPVSLMEAMAMEIPPISTYVSGIPELIEHGKNGLLVSEKNAPELADAIQLLLEDGRLRSRLGKNARQKIVEAFNIRKSGAQLAALFEQYVGPEGAGEKVGTHEGG